MRHNAADLVEARKVRLWCDHCNASIAVTGVLSCLRKACQTKDRVPLERRTYHQ